MMYENIINEMNPKPIFNLKWYANEDKYSDGDVEDLIIQKIIENQPENYTKAISENYNWPVFYHLTHVRKNILNWYPFENEAEVLEIGCGFGAITNLLCEKCKHVTAVELSKRRATGALLRCRERSNLEIIVGNLNDIQLNKKFDYITLIGVLEYQGKYTDTENPYVDFLKKIKTLLKPEGKLLIAIENKCGLKYWCGAREDHTGIPFDGLNGYRMSGGGIRTFSKEELKGIISESGYKQAYFYYPMPDYKLPEVIYSEKQLPRSTEMFEKWLYYIPNTYTMPVQEKELYHDIIHNGVFEFFANSYLVECSDADDLGKVIFAKLNSERLSEYRIGTRFCAEGKVEKFSINGEASKQHIYQTLQNHRNLSNRGLMVTESSIENGVFIVPFFQEKTVQEYLFELYEKGDTAREEIFCIWDTLYAQISDSAESVPWQENIIYSLGIDKYLNPDKYGKILQVGYLDLVLRNAFVINGKMHWFDQEWILEKVPANYIMYRAMCVFYGDFPKEKPCVSVEELAIRYNLGECWDDFNKLESLFMKSVNDSLHIAECASLQGTPSKDALNCVQRIINQ